MSQKGFVNIILVMLIVALAGGGVYVVATRQVTPPALGPTPSPTVTPIPLPTIPTATPSLPSTPTPPSVQPTPQDGQILSVVDLTGNKEAYLGKRVRVQGRIVVNIFYSERKCAEDDPVCDTTMGARLELWQPKTIPGAENFLLPFVNNQPHPCQKTAPATYTCPPYINNQITTIEGVWSKDQVPIQWIGSSSGKPPIPIKWEDRYFLNIE